MSRRPIVIVWDVLTVFVAAIAVRVMMAGGFIARLPGIRLSFRTPARVLVWVVVAVLVRVAVARREGPFGVPLSRWRQWLLLPRSPNPLPMVPRGWGRRTLIAAAGMAVSLAILLQAQIRDPYGVPDYGDPLFSMWRIGWVLHQLVAHPMHLFDANIFYPNPLTLTYSDPLILPAIMAAPLAAIGIHPVIVYDLLFFSGFWLSGVATYLLVERLTGSPLASFVAGLTFACCAYRFDHYGHFELQMAQWMPAGLLALHEFVATGRRRYAVLLALAGVAQLYSSMYYGVFFLVYAAVVGAGLLIVHRSSLRPLIAPLVVSALIAAVLTAPLALAFAAAAPAKGERPISEITYYSAVPADYLRASKSSAIWTGRLLPPLPERALFPGAVPLALAVVGLVPPVSGIGAVYAVALVASVDLSFGMHGLTYPAVRRLLPPFRELRAPARFGALVSMTLAILAGFGTARILRACRRPSRQWIAVAALIVAVIVDAWPALALVPAWKEPPPIYRSLIGRSDVVLAEFPVLENEAFNVPYMYFSLWHWMPMVNGYSGFIPKSYWADTALDLLKFPTGDSIAALRRRGVTHVTLNCGLRYPGCDEIALALRQSKAVRLIDEGRWRDAPVQLYELARE